MKIINASYQIMSPDLDDHCTYRKILKEITESGYTAYKASGEVTDEKVKDFVKRLIQNGHESVLEHVSMRVKFIVDRGISHELVRHRIASFTQESTRYCNYSKDKFGNEITVIEPVFFNDISIDRKSEIFGYTPLLDDSFMKLNDHERAYCYWAKSCMESENAYFCMLACGSTPQEARSVLPNSLKTEVMMTTNLREWRHILNLRAAGTTGKPHPQMLEVAVPLLNELRLKLPVVFEDIIPMEV